MRKISFLFFMMAAFLLPAHAQHFGYPIEGEPWYYIQINLEIPKEQGEGPWKINQVLVGEKQIKDYLLFQNGIEIYDNVIPKKQEFTIKLRHAWEGMKKYTLRIYLESQNVEKSLTLTEDMEAPPEKGYWDPMWKNYLSFIVEEEHGILRNNLPVHATVGVLSKYWHTPNEIRMVKVLRKGQTIIYQDIPCQVYDVVKWKDKNLLSDEEKDEESGLTITRYHPTITFSLAFLVDLNPNEKATYLVFYNNPSALKPKIKSDLRVSGKGLGRIIENSFYRIELDEKSGMIFKILEKKSKTLLEHKLETNGAIHWNPGAYSPPHAWTHCSDWDLPEFSEVEGPVFYTLRRSAPLPHLKDVWVNIDYYFYSDSPLILMESVMLVNENLYVKALRNGEIVFNKEVFKETAYKTLSGKIETIDFTHTRMHPEHVTILRPDIPWVSFLNQEQKVAFACLFLDYSTSCLQGGQASQQQPYIYVQNGPWYYMSRAFVYSFGSNNQTRMLPVKKGSMYSEKTGLIPFSYDQKDEYTYILNNYYDMYKYPLGIHEVLETYQESPEGWLVPILTEPFDEGVEGAIGGKKKK